MSYDIFYDSKSEMIAVHRNVVFREQFFKIILINLYKKTMNEIKKATNK